MRKLYFYYLILISVSICSCSSKKDILYFQDLENKDYVTKYSDYKIQVDDIIKIDINSEIPESALIFNKNPNPINNTANRENMLLNGYLVDVDGNINFPILGEINVEGKTIRDLRNYLYSNIVNNGEGYLLNPFIDVKVINLSFTILGEVNNPGKYNFLNNNFDILEAIGMAGDLTINGKRDDVKIIRKINDRKIVKTIDLTKSNILTDDNFQIFAGDIIIVNPNYNRVKNAGIIGNSGTLLSLLSFILSSIIVINN